MSNYFQDTVLPSLLSAADPSLQEWVRQREAKHTYRRPSPTRAVREFLHQHLEKERPYLQHSKYLAAREEARSQLNWPFTGFRMMAEDALIGPHVYAWFGEFAHPFEPLSYYQGWRLFQAYKVAQTRRDRLIERYKKTGVDKKHYPKPVALRDVVSESLRWPSGLREQGEVLRRYFDLWANDWGLTRKEKQTGDQYTRIYKTLFGSTNIGEAPSLENLFQRPEVQSLLAALREEEKDKANGVFWYFSPSSGRWTTDPD